MGVVAVNGDDSVVCCVGLFYPGSEKLSNGFGGVVVGERFGKLADARNGKGTVPPAARR